METKKKKYNKVIILVILISLLILFGLSLLLVNTSSSNQNQVTVNQLRELALKNNFGLEKDFPDCKKQTNQCAKKASELIIAGVQITVPFINFDQQVLESDGSQLLSFVSQDRYKEALSSAQLLVKNYNARYLDVWSKNKTDYLAIKDSALSASALPKESVFVANYLISLPFAKASLFISNNNQTDLGFVYLTKSAEKWSVIIGPGTSFTSAELKAVGLKDNIIKKLT